MIIIDANRLAGDRLVATLRDWVGQTVLPVVFVRSLHAEIHRNLGVLRQAVVHLPTVDLLYAAVIEPTLEIIVDAVGVLLRDRREKVLDLDRNRVEARSRNDIALEWVTHDLAIHRSCRRRVVNRTFHDIAPERVSS